MPRRPVDARLVQVPLERGSGEPLHRQIHRCLRDAILAGQLEPWSRLPSTRGMAQELGVSRNTVLRAFEQLAAEGLLSSAEGSGCRVHPQLPTDLAPAAARSDRACSRTGRRPAGEAHLRGLQPWIWQPENLERPFVLGMPSVRHFPHALWARLLGRRLRQGGVLEAGDELGSPKLRRAICSYVQSARGVDCTPEQILITDGSQQGLDLIGRLLIQAGEEVWVEEPGYLGARWAFEVAGARLVGIPQDEDGLDLDAAPVGKPRLIYVTPSNQFPLGRSMGMARRIELLRWAHEHDAWIVEDDYDSEFRVQPQPVTSLQGLDQHQRVLYLGTFSKTLSPSLRIGYLILPPDLVQSFARLRFVASNQFVSLEQQVLAEFLEQGHFATHVTRMRRVYRRRRQALMLALQAAPPGLLTPSPHGGGMHQLVDLPPGVDALQVSAQAEIHGIRARPLARYCLNTPTRSALVLGYASVDEDELRRGVEVLTEIVRGTPGPAAR